jgi:hypothetical protein
LIFSALEVRVEFELFTSGVITASAKANDQGRFKIIQGVRMLLAEWLCFALIELDIAFSV